MSGGTIEGPTVVIGADASRVETALSGLKSQFSSFGSELSGISNGFNLDNVASQFDRVAGGMQKMGAAMSLMGVPMGLLAKESIGMFADLESQIQRNTALLNGGKAEYEQILALSKELGASSPFDALEISKGIESLAAAGYSLQEIQAAMPTITNMAVATGEDLNSMSEILVATLNSYGEAADKAGMYGDKLATIANISSAGVTDFGESIKYVGGVVKAFGVDIDELGAVLGALADVNIKGSSAGTALRSIITDLVSPTAAVNDIFASFGLTMDELNPKTNDFVEILQKMKDAGVSDEALMAAFQERGGPVAIQMINQLDKIKENYNTLQNESAGMLEDFAAQMRDSLKFVMDEMGGTISNIMIEIGEGLKPIVEEIGAWLNENQDTIVEFAKNAVDGLTPVVTQFMDLAKKLMDWFNSLPKDLQSKIAGLTGLGGAMATIGGPLLLLGSLPVSGIAKIAGALKELFSLGNAAGGIAGAGKAAASVVPLVRSLAQLAETTPKIAGVTQYLVPIGPAAAGAAGEVGLLAAALATLGGPGIAALAGVSIAIVAWETDFMGVRTAALDAAESIIAGFSNAVSSALEFASGAGPALNEAFWGALSDPNYQSQLIPNLQAVFAEATDTAELEGRAAASAWIDNWNSEIASGRIKAPEIPDSQTASRTNTGINEPYPDGMHYVNGSFQPIPTGASVVNGTVYAEGAAQYAEEQKKLNSLFAQFPTQQAQASQQGTQTGMEGAAPVIAEQTGNSVAEALAKDREWYNKGELDVAMAERFLAKNPEFAEKYAAELKESAEETTKETKSSGEKIVKSLEELKTEAFNKDQDSFIDPSTDTKYKWDDASGEYIKWTKAESMAAERAKEQEKATKAAIKSQEKFIGQFEAGLNPQKVADTLYSKYGSDALKGKEFQIGDLLYKISQTESGGIKTSGTDEVSKKIIDALNTINSTNDKLQKELAKQTKTNKKGEITGGPDKAKIADYNNEIKAAQDILNKYGVSQTKGIQSTDLLNTSLDKTSTSTSNLDKSVQTTGDNILNFSDPVKVATNNVFTFGPAVSSATEALLQVPGAIDKILNVESSAMDSLAESRSKQLQQDFDASVNASDLKKSITEYLTESAYWTTKTAIGSGHTEDSYIYQDNLKGDLLAQLIEMQNPVDFAPSGWARRTQASEWLSSQNTGTQTQYLQIVDDLMTRLEQIDFYEGVKSGKVKAVAEEGEVDMGHLSRRVDIVGLDGLNTGVEKTGTEAKTTTPQINTLNSAFEKIGLTGSGLSDVLSSVNQSLSNHRASILESQDYLSKYNQAAGENTKYTQKQEQQTNSLMNSLGMLGTAQDMYNNYMSDGVLDATEASHVQQALAQATKLMGDAGVTAQGGISGLPGALQALAGAAQAAMSAIQAAIGQAQAAASAAASGWKMQTSPTKYPTIAPSSPTNFTINMNGNSFPAGTKPGDVIRDLTGQLRIVA